MYLSPQQPLTAHGHWHLESCLSLPQIDLQDSKPSVLFASKNSFIKGEIPIFWNLLTTVPFFFLLLGIYKKSIPTTSKTNL